MNQTIDSGFESDTQHKLFFFFKDWCRHVGQTAIAARTKVVKELTPEYVLSRECVHHFMNQVNYERERIM